MIRSHMLLLGLLLLGSAPAQAESCLNDDRKGHEGDARYYDYVACKPKGGASQSYNSLGIIGGQMQEILSRRDADDGYTDAEREANRRADQAYKQGQSDRRARLRYGAYPELGSTPQEIEARYRYLDADISAEQRSAIRREIGAAIAAGRLLETYGGSRLENAASWKASEPAQRWKNCELGTLLSRAYLTGDFIAPEQKNPALGYAIADAGAAQNCGGTGYWLARAMEAGEAWVPGIDKEIGTAPKSRIEYGYSIAIINGYTPAYERMAELYRLGGPERYRGKTYFVLADFAKYPYWRKKVDSDEMALMRVQYGKCLEADPANLVCAQGLSTIHSDQSRDFLDGYTNYDARLSAYYKDYVTRLQQLLAQAAKP